MAYTYFALVLVAFLCIVCATNASEGDADPFYRACVAECEDTGCVEEKCFQHCKFSADGKVMNGLWYMNEPLYLRWKHWDCRSDCQYNCMLTSEVLRKKLGAKPVKYHNRWPFYLVYGIQEPVSVGLCALNLGMQFHGWVSFVILVYYKLPVRPDKKAYYEYTSLFHIFAILAMNAMFWSGVSHSRLIKYLCDLAMHAIFRSGVSRSRDVGLTKKLDYSSAAAVLGFTLFSSVIRAFDITNEASRTMVATPLIGFVTTHILYLNFYDFNPGLNMKVCLVFAISQLLVLGVFSILTTHPSRWKLWVVVTGGFLFLLSRLHDVPPYRGFVDGHALWRAATIPLTFLFWSFIRDDALLRTSTLLKKNK